MRYDESGHHDECWWFPGLEDCICHALYVRDETERADREAEELHEEWWL